VSPSKNKSSKVEAIKRQQKSRHNKRNVVQHGSPQMGGGKTKTKRIASSQQRMESGGYNRAHIRNGGMDVIASHKPTTMETSEAEAHQIPVKIFEMHGNVRAPFRVEEMQGSTIYRQEMDYHNTIQNNPKRTSSKHLKNRDTASRKSRGKIGAAISGATKVEYTSTNPLYSQSMPLRDPGFGSK